MTDLTKPALEVANAQRSSAKRATLAKLKNKKRATKEFTTELDGEQLTLLYRAIGASAYDTLLTAHPPKKKQLAEGAQFDSDTFAPALLAAVCAEPKLTESDWTEIWTSDSWNRGEVSELFWGAVELCNKGLDLTPTAAD